MPPKIARLAGLGAFGACLGLLALFAFIAVLSAPGPLGGMTLALSAVAWISGGLVLLALVALHIVIGRQLLEVAKGGSRPA